jgi:hypothetical protein
VAHWSRPLQLDQWRVEAGAVAGPPVVAGEDEPVLVVGEVVGPEDGVVRGVVALLSTATSAGAAAQAANAMTRATSPADRGRRTGGEPTRAPSPAQRGRRPGGVGARAS